MLTILIGKSAAGKDSICNELVKKYDFKRIVTYTTRPPRKGEVDGVDYHFISDDTFLKMIENDEFLEYRTYRASFGDVSYGSLKKDYLSDGKNLIILTPSGLEEVLKKLKDEPIRICSIYLKASDGVLIKRLKERGDAQEEIIRRLSCDNEDFKGVENEVVHVIVNDGTLNIPQLATYINTLI